MATWIKWMALLFSPLQPSFLYLPVKCIVSPSSKQKLIAKSRGRTEAYPIFMSLHYSKTLTNLATQANDANVPDIRQRKSI